VYALDIDPQRVQDAVAGGADHGLEVNENVRARMKTLTGGVGVDHASSRRTDERPAPLGADIARSGALTLSGMPDRMPRGRVHEGACVPSLPFLRPDGMTRSTRAWLDYPLGYVVGPTAQHGGCMGFNSAAAVAGRI